MGEENGREEQLEKKFWLIKMAFLLSNPQVTAAAVSGISSVISAATSRANETLGQISSDQVKKHQIVFKMFDPESQNILYIYIDSVPANSPPKFVITCEHDSSRPPMWRDLLPQDRALDQSDVAKFLSDIHDRFRNLLDLSPVIRLRYEFTDTTWRPEESGCFSLFKKKKKRVYRGVIEDVQVVIARLFRKTFFRFLRL